MRPLTLLLALTALPVAAAASLSLDSQAPVALDGLLDVRMPGGSLFVYEEGVTEAREIRLASGRVTVWTWPEARADVALPGDVTLRPRPQADDATSETFEVADATLRVLPGGDPFELVVQSRPGGIVAVSGAIDAEGLADVLERHPGEPVVSAPPLHKLPDDVTWYYRMGWTFSGNWLGFSVDPAFPFPEDAIARVEGDVRLKVGHGLAEFEAADGRLVSVALGAQEDGPATQVHRRLIFEGVVARAEVPARGQWAIAGPEPEWALDGRAAWRNATGEGRSEEAARPFDDAHVAADGLVSILPAGAHAAEDLTRGEHYEARGAFDLHVDGAPALVAPTPVVDASAQTVGLVALVLAFVLVAWKGVATFYTRLDPGEVLLHPRRRAIHEAVRDHPGERVRDLQRRVDLAWGTFRFHLDVLKRTGHVHLVREGPYLLVVPAAPPRGAPPLIAHPSARAVFDALPADGSLVPVQRLREQVGFSRQLLDHHLQALTLRGIVEIVRHPDGARDVRRALPPPATGSKATS